MEAENLLNLFDTYWYDLDFFKRSKPTKHNNIPEMPSSNTNNSDHNIPILPTIHTKSSPFAKISSNSKLSDFSASPNSVLQSPKLKTIFSGKETNDFEDSNSENPAQEQYSTTSKDNSSYSSLKGNIGISRTRKKKRLSKSLSDLEFQELKGFMDLGFVFSEEDKDSTLASIIPGLQRLGNKTNNHNNNINNNNNNSINNIVSNVITDDKTASKGAVKKSEILRPYLSEAWEVLEKKRKESCVLNWKVPASTSQIDMKGYLKSWAHNVASTVKIQ